MAKWPMMRLGDVCEINMGQSPSSESYNDEKEGIPFHQGNVDFGEIHPKARVYCNKPIKIANKNDVLLSVRAPIGALNIANEKCCIGRGLCAITEKENISYYKFIYYVLKRKKAELVAKGTGSTFKAINKANLLSIRFPLPPLNVQKNIANTLDKTQEIIDGYKKLLAELDNLIKAVFYKMFGDPVTNEKGLKAAKIKDFFIVKSGSTPNRNCNEYWKDGSIPWIKTTEIKENYIYSSEEYITELAAKECRLTRMPKGTILVAMYGQGQTRGRTAKLMVNATINQACAALVKKNDNINVDFVWHFLMISYEQLRSLGRGGNQPNLNKSLVENFEILIPDISLQTKFADIVTKIEEQKALVKQAITESEHLFNSLMSEYFD